MALVDRKMSCSDWNDGFLFVGNHLTLDFLNTRPVQNGEFVELLPDFSSLLRWLSAAALFSAADRTRFQREWEKSIRAQRTLETIRELREGLRKEILAWEDGHPIHHSTVEELNGLMSSHPMVTQLKSSHGGYSTDIRFLPKVPEDLISPFAHSAATLFTLDRNYVRKCEHCVLHFHDTSKKGTRRWCSMNLCGNRNKVAAYADRQRLKLPSGRNG